MGSQSYYASPSFKGVDCNVALTSIKKGRYKDMEEKPLDLFPDIDVITIDGKTPKNLTELAG